MHTSGHGEGEVFLGSVDVVTDGSGQGLFSVTLATVVPFGHFITATATSPDGATSEFSQALAVVTITVQPEPMILVVGRTFEDLDREGPELAGPGLAGQTILLLDEQGHLISTTITQTDNPATPEDESGWYLLPNLQPGTYIVAHQKVAGWAQSHPADQGIPLPEVDANPGVHVVTLSTTNDLEVLDFGIYRSVNDGHGSISGHVYIDVNNNGNCDPQETRLPNVPITIDGPVRRLMMTEADENEPARQRAGYRRSCRAPRLRAAARRGSLRPRSPRRPGPIPRAGGGSGERGGATAGES